MIKSARTFFFAKIANFSHPAKGRELIEGCCRKIFFFRTNYYLIDTFVKRKVGKMSVFTIVVAIFLILLIALMIIPRLIMASKTAKLKGQLAPTPHKPSEKRIKSGQKTVLYFFTPSCGACRMLEPVIDKLKKHHSDAIYKIDASRNGEAAMAYGVLGVPFVVFIEKAKVVSAKVGVQPESVFTTFLQANS